SLGSEGARRKGGRGNAASAHQPVERSGNSFRKLHAEPGSQRTLGDHARRRSHAKGRACRRRHALLERRRSIGTVLEPDLRCQNSAGEGDRQAFARERGSNGRLIAESEQARGGSLRQPAIGYRADRLDPCRVPRGAKPVAEKGMVVAEGDKEWARVAAA